MSTAPASASSSNPSVSAQFTYSNAAYFPVPFHLQQQPYVAAPPPSAPPVKVPSVYQAPAPLPGVYSLPQYHQAQQLFQRDAQSITPEALESVKAALASSEIEHKAETKKKAIPRKAAGQNWEDPTLAEWPESMNFCLLLSVLARVVAITLSSLECIYCSDSMIIVYFVVDLGNEVNDDVLSKAFARFPSFNMAKVVRDKRTGKTKGYGFVSFSNPLDLAAALKEMNGKYVGNRPIKLRKSNWKERTDNEALERQKHHSHKKPKLAKKSVLHK
ncbi:RNA-binding (RRM/RBD/RNP motifs) family protein [Actinidia rufa]|uniref:RNA-binding (RRM/RBD/RNP motifs) family protein n=1 Tax=Actinidia rufa TaxID=165716 RepID=A0A7J0G588_9ERIC|nr:RNA-binding (RRM/RBD/RNP motifs) family protein [Actinidia rufa]